MYSYYFEDDIHKDSVNELVERLWDKDKVKLYFATFGGEVDSMKYLIDVLNDKKNLTVVLNSYLGSAGTLLLTEYTGKLKILPTVEYFLFHKFDREVYTLRKQKVNNSKLLKFTEEENKIFAEKLKQKEILTDKQIKQFLKGEDVIIYREQILKFKTLL